LGRNFLKGQQGDAIKLLLASAASNLSLWLRRVFSALFSVRQTWWKNTPAVHHAQLGLGF